MAVGKIVANVIANTGPFQAGLKEAGKDAKAFGKTVGKGAGQLAKITAAAGLAGGALVTALVVKGLAAVDAQAKLARSVGGTQRGLVGLTRAAMDAGVAEADVGKTAQKMNRALGDAIQKGGKATGALKRLGLTAEELAASDVDERFAKISDAMNDQNMNAAAVAATLGELGITNKEMIVLMQGGGDAIRAATEEMDRYGVAVSDIEAAQIESLNDAMDRGKEVMKGVANQLAVRLAPLIQGVVELLGDMSGETQGFGEIMDTVIGATLKGVGWLADRLANARLGFAAMGFGLQAVGTVVTKVFAGIAGAIESTIQGVAERINSLIRMANQISPIKLPEIEIGDSDFVNVIQEMSRQAEAELAASKERLAELARSPLPSEALEEWVSTVRTKSREAATAAIEERKKQNQKQLEVLTEGQTREEAALAAAEAKAAETRQKTAENKLAALQGFLRSEVDAENFAHAEKLANLEAAAAELGISEEQRMALREDLESGHVDRLNAIRQKGLSEAERFSKKSWHAQTAQVVGELAGLLQGVTANSRAMFNVQKVGAIAQALVSTYAGAARALQAYPPPLSFAMAGAQVAAGLANVAAIKSQSFSGGGGGAAPSAGAAAAAGAAAGAGGGGGGGEAPGSPIPIDPSAIFSGRVVADFAEELLEFQRNGGKVVLT